MTATPEHVVIIVPALNEEQAIGGVVEAALDWADTVLVIDDGSTDRTSERAQRAGATVIRHETNRGVGAAVATGLVEAQSRGAHVAVQIDGDGQHDAASVPMLLRAIEAGAELVVGNRFDRGFKMGMLRRGGTRIFAAIVARRTGVPIEDPTSGFRAFGPRAMECLPPVFPEQYLADTVELILIAHEQGLVITTVPVRMFERTTGKPSEGPLRSMALAVRLVGIILRHTRGRRST